MAKKTVHEIITERILERLEQGEIPWKKPWISLPPANMKSQREYNGINRLLLGMSGYSSRWWLTWNQIQERGGQVRKDEKSTFVVFMKNYEKKFKEDDGTEKIETRWMLRYYKVWNIEQVEGIEPREEPTFEHNPIEEAEAIVENMPRRPEIEHKGQRAAYNPLDDTVKMPPREKFPEATGYYATLFHELAHATGHPSRVGRPRHFDENYDYAKEELVAEMSAAFLCNQVGIIQEREENVTAYIQSWLKALKNDKTLVIWAGAQAQKAFDYIMGKEVAVKVADEDVA